MAATSTTPMTDSTERQERSRNWPPEHSARPSSSPGFGPAYLDRRARLGLRRCERGLQLLLELLLGVSADHGLDGLAALEEDHRGDRQHLEARGRLRVLVDVELDDAQVRALGGDLLEHGGHDAAGTAPGRPE